MQYISPIKILMPFIGENEDIETLNLNLLKKRILSEFELLGTAVIKKSEKEFSKNDVLRLFENYQTIDNLAHHIELTKHPVLLNFLENNQLTDELTFEDQIFKNKDFIDFLSPLLAHSLGGFLANSILKSSALKQTIPESIPVKEQHRDTMIQPVIMVVEGIILKLESIMQSFESTDDPDDVSKVITDDLIEVLNNLPKKYYSNVIDWFAGVCLDFSRSFFVYRRWDHTYLRKIQLIIFRLKKLQVSEKFRKNIEKPPERKSSFVEWINKNPGPFAGLFVLAIFLFFGLLIPLLNMLANWLRHLLR